MGWHWGILAASGAGAAGAYEHIQSTILTGSQASVTFSSIPATYKHLQIRYTARATSGYQPTLFVRMNGQTGTTYSEHALGGNGSIVFSEGYSSQTSIRTIAIVGGDDTANIYGAGIVDILDYASTSKNTTIRAFHALPNAAVARQVRLASGLIYNYTPAITSIEFFTSSNDLVSGSRFSLYGIKG